MPHTFEIHAECLWLNVHTSKIQPGANGADTHCTNIFIHYISYFVVTYLWYGRDNLFTLGFVE